jgi:hypothetical protein
VGPDFLRHPAGILLVAVACGGRVEAEVATDAAHRPDPVLGSLDAAGPFDATTFPAGDASAPRHIGDASTAFDGAQDAPTFDAEASDANQAPCDGAVPICVEYFAAVSACFNRNELAGACQETLIPDGSDRLAYIVQLCEVNLQRIQQACR